MSFDPRHQQVALSDRSVHVVELGDPDARPIVFLHGWPQSWVAWEDVMQLAARDGGRAIDLPGIGESGTAVASGSKAELAACVHELVTTMALDAVTLVGHDVGGMAVFAYVRRYRDLARAVIADTVIPGVPPWDDVIRNPHLWHFAFHAIPSLPERLVQGHQDEYFDYFYDAIAGDPARITLGRRKQHAAAYATDDALTAGLDWYRALPIDAEDNARAAEPVETPVRYVRGDAETGRLDDYAAGLRAAGIERLTTAEVPGAGHFAPEEAPAELWARIRDDGG